MDEALIVNNDDIEIIKNAIKEAHVPLNARMDDFNTRLSDMPCAEHSVTMGEHGISINTLETQRDAFKEQKKDTKDSKDWMLKILVAAVAVLGLLEGIGFFRSVAK